MHTSLLEHQNTTQKHWRTCRNSGIVGEIYAIPLLRPSCPWRSSFLSSTRTHWLINIVAELESSEMGILIGNQCRSVPPTKHSVRKTLPPPSILRRHRCILPYLHSSFVYHHICTYTVQTISKYQQILEAI